jgi:hypothetical protein
MNSVHISSKCTGPLQTTLPPWKNFSVDDKHQTSHEMELQFLKLHLSRLHTVPTSTILTFISKRSLPFLKPNLLGCNTKGICELIQYAQKIQRIPVPFVPFQTDRPPSTNLNKNPKTYFPRSLAPQSRESMHRPNNGNLQRKINEKINNITTETENATTTADTDVACRCLPQATAKTKGQR